MVNFLNKILSSISERIIKMYDLDNQDEFMKRLAKFVRWWGTKAIPFLIQLAVSAMLLKFAFIWYDRFGYEKTLITLLVFSLLIIRSIGKSFESKV